MLIFATLDGIDEQINQELVSPSYTLRDTPMPFREEDFTRPPTLTEIAAFVAICGFVAFAGNWFQSETAIDRHTKQIESAVDD